MSRIAVPMIGGMVSSTVLTLVVIPAVYALIKGRGLAKVENKATEGVLVLTSGQSQAWIGRVIPFLASAILRTK